MLNVVGNEAGPGDLAGPGLARIGSRSFEALVDLKARVPRCCVRRFDGDPALLALIDSACAIDQEGTLRLECADFADRQLPSPCVVLGRAVPAHERFAHLRDRAGARTVRVDRA